MSRSAWRAAASAGSSSSVTTAFSFLPVVDRRSRQPSVSATGESCLLRMRDASSRTGRKKTEGSSIAASGVEGDVRFVRVRELGAAQTLAVLDPVVEFLRDALHLVGVEVLPITALDDRRERLGVIGGRLRRFGGRLRGV